MSDAADQPFQAPVNGVLLRAGRLWERAPCYDSEGLPTSDLLLWVPQLAERGALSHELLRQALLRVCRAFEAQVLLVEVNLQRGTIWFSVEGVAGLTAEIAQAVRAQVPDARVIGMPLEVRSRELAPWWQRARRQVSRIRQRVWRRLLPSPPGSETH